MTTKATQARLKKVMQKQIPVTTKKWERYLQRLQEAVGLQEKPRGWRLSEYAATKAHAIDSLKQVEQQLEKTPETVTLDYFSWGVLEGEIARYYAACNPRGQSGKRADLLDLFEEITTQCQQDPDVGWAIRRLEMIESKKRKIEDLQSEIDSLESEINTL